VICDPDSMSRVTGVPRSLLVIGADIVGCEYSCMLATLGTAVTLVDRRTRLLRFVDHDLREVLHEEMRRLGITIVLGERVERLEVLGSGEATHAVALLGSGRIERVDRVLVAAGGLPNVEDLGLEQLGISVTTQGVAVETDGMETCVAGTFAVGGVVDPLAPVGAAIHQGRRAALHAIGIGDSLGAEVPLVVHSVPEIGSVGLSEEACRHLGIECLVSRSPLGVSHGGRLRAPEGFLKLVAEKTTARLIGVHAIGPRASEIVNLGAAIMAKRTTLAEIANVSFSPGSACEAYHLAAVAGLERWSAGVGRGIGGLPDPPSHARTERHG
jgi:NAD(P) transhydrogenase